MFKTKLALALKNVNKILFIPGIPYLADPHFLCLAEKLKDFQLIYLYTKDSYRHLMNLYEEKIDLEGIEKYFNVYDEIDAFKDYSELNPFGRLDKYKIYSNYIKGVRNKLNNYKPDCIISGSDKTLSQRIAIKWARKRNVPYIILQVAFLENTAPPFSLRYALKYFVFNKLLSKPIYKKRSLIGEENKETHLFLWGEQFKKLYKKKRVYVLGNPLFDKVLGDPIFKVKLSEIEAVELSKTVLICSDNNDNLRNLFGGETVSKTMQLWYESVKRNPDLKFIIKPHPGDNKEEFDNYFGKLRNVEIINDKNLYDLFKISDVQISVNSASSFEAVAAGLPIILTNLDESGKLSDFFNNEIELKAKTQKQLTKAIGKALTQEYLANFKLRREEFLRKRLFSLDGKSAERIANEIEEITKGNRGST